MFRRQMLELPSKKLLIEKANKARRRTRVDTEDEH